MMLTVELTTAEKEQRAAAELLRRARADCKWSDTAAAELLALDLARRELRQSEVTIRLGKEHAEALQIRDDEIMVLRMHLDNARMLLRASTGYTLFRS